MTTREPDLTARSRRLARELALDVSYFSDPAVRHYDPVSVAESLGLILLGAFLDGVRQGLKEQGTALGTWFVKLLASRTRRLWEGGRQDTAPPEVDADEPPPQREYTAAEVATAISLVEQLTAEYLASLGMSQRRAAAIAAVIRSEAELTLMP